MKKFRLKHKLRQWLRYGFLGVAGLTVLSLCTFHVLRKLYPFPQDRVIAAQTGGATQILDREGGLVAWRVDAAEQWRVPVKIEDVSPWMIKATIAAEDKRFWSHRGVDPVAVCRALAQNLRHARRISGASTLTMQSIRLLWPRPRTWPSKCIEAFRALEFEDCDNKHAVLQLYFNLAPYGGNVIGIEAAARHYFGKPASELTLGEAALLAGIPQSPARFNPKKHLDAALHRREYVLERIRTLGLASAGDIEAALRETIRLADKPVQTDAPRFADFIIQRLQQTGGIHRTTLCPKAQAIAHATVEKHARKFREMGIDGLAIVIVDVKDASLAAMVGNIDPRNPLTGGINAATARRQPGSLLKPFIYCAAYDQGLLTPQSVVYDVPTAWRGYRPENMDREFLGPISAAQALSWSRNIPAVKLLDSLGAGRLAGDMRKMNLKFRGAADKYGLSLALGTAELRLVDIANAYATLARLGKFRPLRILADEPTSASRKVYSPGAAWLTLRSLGAAESGKASMPVWKTGTSWNYRDAWAVSLTPKYIIAVWCGRFSGQGHPALVGANTALPIALDITGQLASDENRSWVRPVPSSRPSFQKP